MSDTNRRAAEKIKIEQNLKKKQKGEVAQISSNSDKVLHDRYDNDFNYVCQQMGIIDSPQEAEQHDPHLEVDCGQASQILLKLGFVQPIALETEQLMIADMWKTVLRGDPEGQGVIPLSNLKNVTRAIQNFHHQDIIDTDREEGLAQNEGKKIGRMTEDGLLFKSNEIEMLTRKYKDFFANRMNKLQNENKNARMQRAIQKNSLGEQFQYSPTYSNRSKRLAYQKQASLTGNPSLKPEDRFMYQAQESEALKEHLQRQEDEKIRKQMTLKPTVSPTSKKLA